MDALPFLSEETNEKINAREKQVLRTGAQVEFLITSISNKSKSHDYIFQLYPKKNNQGINVGIIGFVRPALDLENSYKSLMHLQESFISAQQIAKIGHWELDLVGGKLFWSDEVYRIFGHQPQDFPGTYEGFLEHIHPDDRKEVDKAYQQSVQEKSSYQIVHRVIAKDGTEKIVEERCFHDFDQDGNVIRSIGTVHDITEIKQAEQKLALISHVFSNTNEGIIITDENNVIIQANDAFLRLTGYSRPEVIGKKTNILKSDWHDDQFYLGMWKSLTEHDIWTGEIWDRRKDGSLFLAQLNIMAVRDKNGKITNFFSILDDITDRKEKEEKINRLAYYDLLTELPNRYFISELIEHRVSQMHSKEQKFALLYVDFDNFKYVNDSLGHHSGDIFLMQISKKMKSLIKESDIILGRISSDEFVFLVESFDSESEIGSLAKSVLQLFLEPIVISGHELFTSCSIGISIYPENAQDAETLIQAAEVAMFKVKEKGKNNYHFFNDTMNQKVVQRMQYEGLLRRVLEQETLKVYYQPKFDISTLKITGMEALVRWIDPEIGFIAPDIFIPIAEEAGLIRVLGLQVLQTALRDIYNINNKYKQQFVVSVNVSGLQLADADFKDLVFQHMKNQDFPAKWLELEITESEIMGDIEMILPQLQYFRQNGLTVSVDDFGTGYSSMSYLKKLPIDIIKIDRSFIMDIDKDEDDFHISKAIISLAHSLNLKVVAEGVETKENLDKLRKLQCEYGQGYFYSKPLPLSDLDKFIENFLADA